jgi:thiamine-phosphate pyrophosphorylase
MGRISHIPNQYHGAMSTEYTAAVTRALEAAQAFAAAAAAAEVGPEHLLRALVRDDDERPALLLTRAGCDLARWRTPTPAGGVALAPGGGVRLILTEARRLARELSPEGSVSSEQVLLALLRQARGLREQLEGLGLRWQVLEEAVGAVPGPPLQLDEPLDLRPAPGQLDAARVLDAGANRAREALRVVEDYCRFVLNDGVLSGELKAMRHRLADTLATLPPALLLESRDTLGDVGTAISTPQEQERAAPADVARANLKRLQEALRSLEEFGKIYGADLGRALEQMRYRAYTLERALLLGAEARERLSAAWLYVLVTGSLCTLGLERTVRAAADGGADVIQLREKHLRDRELLQRAYQVRQWTRQAGVLFIVNDRPDIARLVEADGVHLGQDELPVREARRVLGPGTLVGVSTHDVEQVRRAVLEGASYIGVGPTFRSGTKEFADFAGLEFVRRAVAETTLPAFVIGGVHLGNVGEVLAAGGRRVAVCQAVCCSEAPEAVAAELRAMLTN